MKYCTILQMVQAAVYTSAYSSVTIISLFIYLIQYDHCDSLLLFMSHPEHDSNFLQCGFLPDRIRNQLVVMDGIVMIMGL